MQTNMNFPTYVFATVNPGRSTNVVEELKRNSQIDMIAPVTGRYDLVLRVKANTPHNVYQTVKEIRDINDIRTNDTHTGLHGLQLIKKHDNQIAHGFLLLICEHTINENAKMHLIPIHSI